MRKKLFAGLMVIAAVLLFTACPSEPPAAYMVTYDGNGSDGGVVPSDDSTYAPGATVTVISAGTMTRTDHNFAGWNMSADGSGANYPAESTFVMGTEAVTLYANWKMFPIYTVSFESNGGSFVDDQTVIEGRMVIEPAAPTIPGYILTGWYKEQALTTLWDFAADAVIEDTTLYAKWAIDPGSRQTFTADGVSFNMVIVPGGQTFPTGVDDNGDIDGNASQDISPTATVADAYWTGETEVTYELWNKVHTWAVSGSIGIGAGLYTFANAGNQGSTIHHPVTAINWRDAMVWCNALTEWYNALNGTNYSTVYNTGGTVIRDSGDGNGTQCDSVTSETSATGFRLLSTNEWELAARWRDDSTNTVTGYNDPWFTRGNSASGATTYYNDSSNGEGEPAKSANNAVAVYTVYWDGDSWERIGVSGKAEVKSKAANALGLYDMSGNVWEMCFDIYPGQDDSDRVSRGGGWDYYTNFLRLGVMYRCYTNYEDNYIGFRFAKTAE